jgi:hypothetical protein
MSLIEGRKHPSECCIEYFTDLKFQSPSSDEGEVNNP